MDDGYGCVGILLAVLVGELDVDVVPDQGSRPPGVHRVSQREVEELRDHHCHVTRGTQGNRHRRLVTTWSATAKQTTFSQNCKS